MPKSLLEQLPEIVANGRKQAERILESIEGRHRVQLQTREIVLPAKDAAAHDWIAAQQRQTQRDALLGQTQGNLIDPVQPSLAAASPAPWANRLIYGDNLLAMAALLAGDERTPSLRSKIDLIYIDPPFDSKADYRRPAVRLQGRLPHQGFTPLPLGGRGWGRGRVCRAGTETHRHRAVRLLRHLERRHRVVSGDDDAAPDPDARTIRRHGVDLRAS